MALRGWGSAQRSPLKGSPRPRPGPGPRRSARPASPPGVRSLTDPYLGLGRVPPSRYAASHACTPRGQSGGNHHQCAYARRPDPRARERDEAGGGHHRVPRARPGPRPAGRGERRTSTWSWPSAATARSTRSSTACCTTAPTRSACPASRWSPAAPPTSSPAPWGCPTTPWRRPAPCWTPCARAASARSASGLAAGTPGTEDEGVPARWFTFCAGLGFDAGVVGRVEQQRERGKRSTHALYRAPGRAAVPRRAAPPARHDHAGAARTQDPVTDLVLSIVCNTSPWTYPGQSPGVRVT